MYVCFLAVVHLWPYAYAHASTFIPYMYVKKYNVSFLEVVHLPWPYAYAHASSFIPYMYGKRLMVVCMQYTSMYGFVSLQSCIFSGRIHVHTHVCIHVFRYRTCTQTSCVCTSVYACGLRVTNGGRRNLFSSLPLIAHHDEDDP